MSITRLIASFAIFGSFAALMHTYIYRRLVRDTGSGATFRKFAIGAAVMITLVFLVLRPLFRFAPRSWAVPISTTVWFWIGYATYLLLWLVVFDVARLLLAAYRRVSALRKTPEPVSPERRLFLSRALAGGALVGSGALTGYGAWRAFQFVEELVRRTNALKPDLVAITGDLVDGDVDQLGEAVTPLRNLKSRYGTFFVTGNHDYYSGDVRWAAALSRIDIQVLRNRRVRIGDAGASFDLVGVDDWGARNLARGGYNLERAVEGRDPDRASVLLAHEPANFETAVESGMGLQLSGHTHGGQLFPLTTLSRLKALRYRGLYTHGPGLLYVSRGVGFWGPPLRVGSPPEIVKVTLVS